MKRYNYLLLILAVLVLGSCEKGKMEAPMGATSSGTSSGMGGNSNANDASGTVKGDDYGDLYVLKRLESGVPEMGVTDDNVWYAKAVAFDTNDEPIMDGNDYATMDVNEEGEVTTTAVNADGETIEVEGGAHPKEVEFGRMNLVRSPQAVLDAGLSEAISGFEGATLITTDFCGRLVAVHGAIDWEVEYAETDDKTIDSPRENMAIYQELMRNGFGGDLEFLGDYFDDEEVLVLAASALAAGSDKTGQITLDEVVYINGFMAAYPVDCIKLYTIWNDVDKYSYYYELCFYNFKDFSYSAQEAYKHKWVKIFTLDGMGGYTEEVKSLYEAVGFNKVETYGAGVLGEDLAGFTQACDDAVQILEYVHESSLVEYLGEFETEPEL